MTTNIYFIRCLNFVKIGRGGDAHKRLAELQVGNPFALELMGQFEASEAEERRLQDAFEPFLERGEWYHLSGQIRSFMERHCVLLPKSCPRRNHVAAFLKATITPSGDGLISLNELRELYPAFADQAGMRLSDEDLMRQMTEILELLELRTEMWRDDVIICGARLV